MFRQLHYWGFIGEESLSFLRDTLSHQILCFSCSCRLSSSTWLMSQIHRYSLPPQLICLQHIPIKFKTCENHGLALLIRLPVPFQEEHPAFLVDEALASLAQWGVRAVTMASPFRCTIWHFPTFSAVLSLSLWFLIHPLFFLQKHVFLYPQLFLMLIHKGSC